MHPPDPFEPEPVEVEQYVRALQELARTEPAVARREAWAQIRLAGQRAARRRAEVAETLERLFSLGVAPEPRLDGPLRGLFVTPAVHPAGDPLLRAVLSAYLPWVGKRFNAGAGSGENLLERSGRFAVKLAWPGYQLDDAGDGRHLAGFRFHTRVAPSELDTSLDVLKIDYDRPDNPSLLVRDVLDELVQIVPGAYLGKMLVRRQGRFRLTGWFALQPPEAVRVEEPATAAMRAHPTPAPA